MLGGESKVGVLEALRPYGCSARAGGAATVRVQRLVCHSPATMTYNLNGKTHEFLVELVQKKLPGSPGAPI
jgi:hypothetical protein